MSVKNLIRNPIATALLGAAAVADQEHNPKRGQKR